MCGIFAYIYEDGCVSPDVIDSAMCCQHRGPDNTHQMTVNNNIFLVFHRLIINDKSSLGNQPMLHPEDDNLILLCNGEIYNWKELASSYGITTHSTSDCEIILHLYKKLGMLETISLLDGDFAFILVDKSSNVIYAGRDPIGVRPLYIATSDDHGDRSCIGIASEMKSLSDLCKKVWQVKPGGFYVIKDSHHLEYHHYYSYVYPPTTYNEETLRELLINSVRKRLLTERPFGCLLSGGLDSSLVAAILVHHLGIKDLHTFSIGLEGSEDLKYAREVADYLGTIHQEYVVSEEEMLNAIPEVIYMIESYDTTTVRASTPMYLLAKYIKETTDITVLFSGEGSDEASGSYLYFKNAPSDEDRQHEIIRLMEDLHYFDVLRSDKSISGAGLELRVPFLDKKFLAYYLGLPSSSKAISSDRMEKHLLRSAFERDRMLPTSVLWRRKEAFSDGVSSQKRSWYGIIQEHVSNLVTDADMAEAETLYNSNPPKFKEALYYRNVYEQYYPGRSAAIPYYWMPKWSNSIDPSARTLEHYHETTTQLPL